MIIFGWRNRRITKGKGEFFCPYCKTTRPYKHQIIRRFFTLYFIPLIPLNTLGEAVECEGCGKLYNMEVLRLAGAGNPELNAGLTKMIDEGASVFEMRQALAKESISDAAARKMIDRAVGDVGYKTCQNCGSVYKATVTQCKKCNLPL
jgi:uncharacterized Zn-finger protein